MASNGAWRGKVTKGRNVPIVPMKAAMDSEEKSAKIVLAVFVVRDENGLVMFTSDKVTTESIRWNANVLDGGRDPSKPLVMESEFSLQNPRVQRVVPFAPGAHAMQQVVADGGAYRVVQAGGLHGGSDPNDAGSTGRPMRFRGRNHD